MNPKEEHEKRYRRIAQWSVVLGLGLVVAMIGIPASKMRSNNRGRMIERGASLYAENCAQCHGDKAQGQDAANPQGGKQPDGSYLAPALNEAGVAWYRTNRQLYDYVAKGSLDQNSPMKGFGEKLSENDITSILVFVQSLWPEDLMKQHNAAAVDVPRTSEGFNF